MEILRWLDISSIVEEYKIEQYKVFEGGFYIKVNVIIKDKSELFIREYSDIYIRSYSYHWQNQKGELKARWDNAPYHPELLNAPHHMHHHGTVSPSREITVQDVLKAISKEIGISK